MNLTVEQVLEQVKHFLETGQPRMAELYMHKALTLIAEQRRQASKARRAKAIADLCERVSAAIRVIWKNLVEVLAPVVNAVTEVFASFTEAFQGNQNDFTLEA